MNSYNDIISKQWGLTDVKLEKEIDVKGDRLIKIISSKKGKFVLKGFPFDMTEDRIKRYSKALEFLGQKKYKLSPSIIKNISGGLYIKYDKRYMYLMEYIDGAQLTESEEDEYKLGQAAAELHTIKDYSYSSCIDVDERINNMKQRFHEHPFKEEYDNIIDSLPDFNKHPQVFIHTDIGPHNAMKTRNGEVIFVDLDDAGMGSVFIDIGFPLICQFVRFQDSGDLRFNYNGAKAFYDGYFSKTKFSREDKEMIFQGAVFMQLMYMPCFGEEHVKYLWQILKFGIDNKELLMSTIL